MTGSLKLVWAIFQSLFIGFVQTIGSDLWLRIDTSARNERESMLADITGAVYSSGVLSGNWTSLGSIMQPVALGVSRTLDSTTPYPAYNYIDVGCYRASSWPWYLQSLHWTASLVLVPLFAFLIALWNMQSSQSRHDAKHLSIMVLIGFVGYWGMYDARIFFFFFRKKIKIKNST
jgi:hypothetical protein